MSFEMQLNLQEIAEMEITNNVLRQKLERHENEKVRKRILFSEDKSQTTG